MDILKNADKNKVQRITLIVVAALTLLALVLLLVIIVASVDKGIQDANLDDIIESLEFESVTITESQLSTGSLVLADSAHPYSVDKSLLNLIGCQFYRNEHRTGDKGPYYAFNDHFLNTTAMAAAHKMLTDAETAVGLNDLLIKYAYGNHDASYKEYDTGLLIYLTNYDESELNQAYAEWLDSNAVKYGFVESFDNGFRYVGEVHAKYMKEKSLTIAQYVAYLKGNTAHDNMLTVKDANGTSYGIYYVSCLAGGSVKAPVITYDDNGNAEVAYEISGTNEGGVIITVKLN